MNLTAPLNMLKVTSIKNSFTIILEKRSNDTSAKTNKNNITSPNFNKISLNKTTNFNFNINILKKLGQILEK